MNELNNTRTVCCIQRWEYTPWEHAQSQESGNCIVFRRPSREPILALTLKTWKDMTSMFFLLTLLGRQFIDHTFEAFFFAFSFTWINYAGKALTQRVMGGSKLNFFYLMCKVERSTTSGSYAWWIKWGLYKNVWVFSYNKIKNETEVIILGAGFSRAAC